MREEVYCVCDIKKNDRASWEGYKIFGECDFIMKGSKWWVWEKKGFVFWVGSDGYVRAKVRGAMEMDLIFLKNWKVVNEEVRVLSI